jgi:hypothetical protein
VDIALIIWELARPARKGIQTAYNNGKSKTATKNNVTAQENQDCCRNEEPTSRRESSAYAKKFKIGLVGAPAGKGGAVGRGDRRRKTTHRTDRLGGG